MFNIKLRAGTVGNNAYRMSKVWKLGIHLFECDYSKIFRVCYLRTNKHTYYFDISKKIGERVESGL